MIAVLTNTSNLLVRFLIIIKWIPKINLYENVSIYHCNTYSRGFGVVLLKAFVKQRYGG